MNCISAIGLYGLRCSGVVRHGLRLRWWLATVLLLLTIGMMGCTWREKDRQPKCFIFSGGFVGWTSVQYDQSSANPLPSHDGCLWLDFRDQSTIHTSSAIEKGWASDRYYERSASNLKPLSIGPSGDRAVQEHIYQFSGTTRKPDASVEYLFVGTSVQRKSFKNRGGRNSP